MVVSASPAGNSSKARHSIQPDIKHSAEREQLNQPIWEWVWMTKDNAKEPSIWPTVFHVTEEPYQTKCPNKVENTKLHPLVQDFAEDMHIMAIFNKNLILWCHIFVGISNFLLKYNEQKSLISSCDLLRTWYSRTFCTRTWGASTTSEYSTCTYNREMIQPQEHESLLELMSSKDRE